MHRKPYVPPTGARRAALAIVLATLVAPAAALLVAREADACAPAQPVGEWVRVANEQAVIVWDEKAHREHFIRRASFRSTSKDFGFLVPTPTQPELAEIDDNVFDTLAWATRPRVEVKTERGGFELGSLFFFALARSSAPQGAAAASAPVRVLDEATVGGFDAVVLEADDPTALAKWLADHGYDARPALAAWLAPYVTARWKITAFKVASAAATKPTGTLGTRAVRMSFDTDVPFFPYREPADQREPGPAGSPAVDGARELLVYVVSAQRVAASIGKSNAFPGSIPFAKHVGAALPPAVASLLPDKDPFVTVVSDPSSPRPGTDELYFPVSGDQGEVEPPPVVHVVREPIFIPLEPLLLLGGIVAAVVLLRSRKRQPS